VRPSSHTPNGIGAIALGDDIHFSFTRGWPVAAGFLARPTATLRRSMEPMATAPSPCRIGRSARLSRQPRSRGRPRRYGADTSDMSIHRRTGRSHIADPHRHTSCDEAPEQSAALERRKPGTLIDPLQSASCGTLRDIRNVMFNKARRDGSARRRRGQKRRCNACERRP